MGDVVRALRDAAQLLEPVSDTARLDAELLMAHALRVDRSEMLLRMGVEARQVPAAFEELVRRRLAREPIAYILGSAEFYGRNFRVTSDVLIPRADSETLIDAARERKIHVENILDLGTGSGALLVTALLEIESARGVGIDVSEAALHVAENNAQRFGLGREQAKFRLRDWREACWTDDLGRFDLILANPPYVEENAALDADVRDYEPAPALFAGPDGLDAYNILIPALSGLLTPGGVAFFEIGHKQAAAVTDIARTHGYSVEIKCDLGGRDRVVILTAG